MSNSLKLTVGKFYRTRDGRKVGPLKVHSTTGPWRYYVEGIGIYSLFGTFELNPLAHDLDLVAEWTAADERALFRKQASQENVPVEPEESELERLVRVANEGLAAYDTLSAKHPREVLWSDGDGLAGLGAYNGLTIVIKPKAPAFPELMVGHGWPVTLLEDGTTLKVGCKQFDAAKLLDVLRDLLQGQGYWNNALQIFSSRLGLRHGSEILTWADADRLLAALESYFKAKEAA